MKAYLHRRYHFSASHRLHADSLSERENQATYGKCNNPFGHGHNYSVEITVSGPIDNETGMVIDLGQLDEVVQKQVVDRFDTTNLNLDQDFLHTVPTTENLTVRIYERLQKSFPQVKLEQVRVEETSNNTFDYVGKEEILH
jgi:6-pyruvoyltetrahydropterin/6-carboxytetrahydropterin synthase